MILGINSFTHDSAIALINEHEPILLIEEERLSRIKHHDGFVFGEYNPPRAIDLLKRSIKPDIIAHSVEIDYSAMNNNIPQLKFLNFAKSLDHNLRRTKFFNHHLCHAASAFYCSKYINSYVVTLDSRGDGLSMSISLGTVNNIKKIFEIPARTSICSIYSYVSELLHLGKRSEGSLMALAAYGNKNISPNLFTWTGNSINICINDIVKSAQKARNFSDLSNIAFTIQNSFEHVVLAIIKSICIDKSIKNLCLAGGGFLNCRLNQKICQTKRWENIYIPPCTGDSGTALGAALLSLEKPSEFNLQHTFWGTRFSKNEVRNKLIQYKIRHHETNAEEIAKLIAVGKVGAIFNGPMEYGPRALGNRSLIADPRKAASKTKLNSIKKRKQWRPIAPSILDSHGTKWFDDYSFSPFMTSAFKIKRNKQKYVPAIMHIDESARIQSVNNSNGFFYELLNAFYKLTDVPLLCNTSFNINSPIVQSPEDALSVFFSSAIDFLYIEGWLITK